VNQQWKTMGIWAKGEERRKCLKNGPSPGFLFVQIILATFSHEMDEKLKAKE
jgi:hypothetical protein